MPKRDNTSRVELKFARNESDENNSKLRSFDAILEDGSESGGITGGYAVKSATGKKFVVKVFDAGSYLLQDITVMQSVLPSFTGRIFFFLLELRAFFRRDRRRNRDLQSASKLGHD